MIKVLGISGSPRGQESTSDRMLCQLLDHVVSFGGKVELVRLIEKNIFQCEGCYSKTQNGEKCTFPCIHDGEDDTTEMLNKISEADAIAIATPVYWGSSSPLIQGLLGKMCALENNRNDIRKKTGKDPILGKPCVFLSSQEGDGSAMALSQLMWAMTHMGFLILPWACIFKPAILNNKLVQFGMKAIRYQKWEWIDNTIRLAARNLVAAPQKLEGFEFDDYLVKEPRC